MFRSAYRTIVGVSVVLMAAGPIVAQQTPQGQQQKPVPAGGSKVVGADRDFLMKAGDAGQSEVAHATLAQTKAQDEKVKALADMIQKDHSANNQELKTLASSKGVEIPATMGPEHKAVQNKLEKADGAAFDRAFAQAMVNGHKQAIALFERGAKSNDSDIKAYAEKTLPTLRMHLKHSQEAQQTMTSSTEKPSSRPTNTAGQK